MRSALPLVLALAATACSDPASPSYGLSVETKVSESTVRPGEPVLVSVIVTNHGEVTRIVDGGPCPEPFVVMRPSGGVVGPAEKACLAIVTARELPPGESFTVETPWAGDARYGAYRSSPSLLPPGLYRLKGRVLVTGEGFVEGAPVTIRVVR